MKNEELSQMVHKEMIARKKTLALAESCTGGALSAQIVKIPQASLFFLGSIVAYSDFWKDHFLQVDRKLLQTKGSVSAEVAQQMVEGIFAKTVADYAIATTGFLGRSEKNDVFLAIGERGDTVDIGHFHAPTDRCEGIEWLVNKALEALWRRVVQREKMFS